MKKRRQRIEWGILAVIFVVAVVIFSALTNQGEDNTTAGLDGASYPQVAFEMGGYRLNSLEGYVEEMDTTIQRDTITPVIRGQVSVVVDLHEKQVDSIDYMVYSLDGKEKLYEASIPELKEKLLFKFSDNGLLEEERLLKIILHMEDGKEIYYYTRIADATEANIKICLDYAKKFHESALLKAEGTGIESALETSSEGPSGTFQHVTIHSNYGHVSWGKMEPKVEENVRWRIKELKNSYTCVELEYQVACLGEENEQDEYQIEEFFKIRHSKKAKETYLLAYDRKMDQIFDPIGNVLSEKGVILGIADDQISYRANKDGTIVSFVQADELWSYNKEKNDMTLIFSFGAEEGYDERNLIRKHKIEILNHSNTGNIRFAVKGYMNRGPHEGEVGVAVYYYDAEERTVAEETFVSYNKALESEVFFNADLNILYVLTDGAFHEFKLDYRSQNVIAEGLKNNEYTVAPAGNMIAYIDKEESENAQKVTIQNLKKKEVLEVTCEEGEVLLPLGFIGTDFIYGVARTKDAGNTISGQKVLPMYKVEILNSKGEIEISYEKPGKYILSGKIEDNMLTVSLADRNGKIYTEDIEDYITNNEAAKEQKITLKSYVTDLKERQMRLEFAEEIEEMEPKILRANQTLAEDPLQFVMEGHKASDKYQVYAYGEQYGQYVELSAAIRDAKKHTGVVVDASQKCVWEMSNRDLVYMISDGNKKVTVLLANLGKGMLPMEAAQAMKDVVCEDLTGCKTEDLLYILNQDIPVVALTNTGNAVVLVGYNEYQVFYKVPGEAETQSVSFDEMDDMTKGSGHTFIGVR